MKNIKKMTQEEQIEVIIAYLNKDLDTQANEAVLSMLEKDVDFAQLFRKGQEVHELVEDWEDRRLLKNWIQPSAQKMTVQEKENLKAWFRHLDKKEVNGNKQRKITYLSYLSLAALFSFLVFFFFLYQSNEVENISSTGTDKTPAKEKYKVLQEKAIDSGKQASETIPKEISEDLDTSQKLEIIPHNNPRSDYPKNPQMEELIAGIDKGNEDWEIKITKLSQEEEVLSVFFTIVVETLSEPYTLEIENYQGEDVYKQKISEFVPNIHINMNTWEAGYYYWKFKIKGEEPQVGRILKAF